MLRPESLPRPAAPGYAGKEPTKPPDWHGLVVWDVFLNAVTTGLFLAAATADLARPELFGPVAAWAYPVALVVLLGDLACLVLDLGDPLRFHHMLRVFKPSSPMSLGTWCLTAYSLPLTAVVAADLFGVWGWVRTVLVVAAVPFAFGSMAYKGVLFSTTAQPGWRDARWLGGYHTTSAVAVGAALLLALAAATGHTAAAASLRPAVALVLVVGLFPAVLLGVELWPALARRHTRAQLRFASVAVLGIGVFLPVVLLLPGGNPCTVGGATAGVLLGAWAARYVLVMLPQPRHES